MSDRPRPRGRGRRGARCLAILAGLASLFLLAAPAVLAHPLGNFTINHFAAVRVAPDGISLDVVIDRAEIPAFQEQQRLDSDGDGVLGPAELDRERQPACVALAGRLALTVDGAVLAPVPTAAGLAVTPGVGGLPTMRLVCEYAATLPRMLVGPSTITFTDRSFPERIGWREIVVVGDGVTIGAGAPEVTAMGVAGASDRLTAYPVDLLTQPLDIRSVTVDVAPGGPPLPAWVTPDARPLGNPSDSIEAETTTVIAAPAGVPGGITEDLAALIDVPDLDVVAILIALVVAFGLGVVHAIARVHGKTIMAAYLVGGRSSTRQAIGLGLAVAVSHTLGVLGLAVITLAAANVLPPERLYPILGLGSGTLVVVIGASLLWGRLRALGGHARDLGGHARDLGGHVHDEREHIHDHGHRHPHPHQPAELQPHVPPHAHPAATAGESISWRGLAALGLSGGLVPSASALILLLGSIAAGRPVYGLVLVVAFGLGMAVVLGGIGFALVHARRLVGSRPTVMRFERLVGPAQVATASLVVVVGVVLTGQALAQLR